MQPSVAVLRHRLLLTAQVASPFRACKSAYAALAPSWLHGASRQGTLSCNAPSRCMSVLPGGVTTLTMPALSPTMTFGSLLAWRAKEGQSVKPGDVICEIGTDKATVDHVSQDDTIVGIHLLPAGTEHIPLGAPLSLLVDDEAALQALKAAGKSAEEWLKLLGSGSAKESSSAAPASPSPTASAPAPQQHHAASGSSIASAIAALPANTVMPAARILLAENGIDPSRVAGSGKGGRITKGDVLSLLSGATPAQATVSSTSSSTQAQAQPSAPATFSAPVAPTASAAEVSKAFAPTERKGGSFTEKMPSQVRRIIAQRLAESKAGIPHQYTVQDCYLDAALKLRAVLKENGVAVSVNDIIIKAAAKALRDVPEANCFYDPKTDTVKPNKTVDVSVAVATEGGLITPIVKGADSLGLSGISGSIKDLAARARANRLKPEEFQGGSFTISNLGMFGIDEFTAVINPPQACILAVGRGEAKVVGQPITSIDDLDPSKPAPEPTVATVMSVTMSSDARVVDAAVAAQFLQVFRHYIQNPALLVA